MILAKERQNYVHLSKAEAISRALGRLLRWSFWTLALLIFLLLVLLAMLLYPTVQTWLAQEMSDRVSKELGITVHIERVELRPFGPNRLRGVFVADLNGDTLLTADDLRIAGLRFRPRARLIEARSVELRSVRFDLHKSLGDSTSNLTQLLNKLASDDTTTSGVGWNVSCKSFLIDDLHFSFHNTNVAPQPTGVDFEHVDVTHADLRGTGLTVSGDSIVTVLEQVSLQDRSGLDLRELSGTTVVSPRGIRIDHMRLRTPRSDLHGELALRTESWSDYDDFTQRVYMRLDLDSSTLQFADVALFATELHGVDLPIRLKGRFRGTVSELKGRKVEIGFGERSVFRGNAELSGLPDIQNTFMVVDVDELRTDANDLSSIPIPPFTSKEHLSMPEEVHRLGDLGFSGNFTGFLNSFTAFGRARTAAGVVRTDMTFDRDTVTQFFNFRGRVASEGFDLARVTGTSTLGPLACDVRVKATGRSMATMKADLEGDVPMFTFNNNAITNIVVNGRLERDLFNGVLQARDPDLFLDFDGLADLRGKWPKVDFEANVQHADLRKLGLMPGEGYNSISARIKAQGELAPDSLKGELVVEELTYCDGPDEFDIGDLRVRSDRRDGQPVLELESTVVDAKVVGPFFPTRLPDAFLSVAYSVFPSLQDEVVYKQEDQHFTFNLEVKRAQGLLNRFVPGLVVSAGTKVNGYFDSRVFDMSVDADVPFISYGAFSGDSVHIILDKTLDVLAFSFKSARQTLSDSTFLSGIELTGKAYQDEVELRAGWSGSSNGTEGDLAVVGQVMGLRSYEFDLLPSKLFFGRGLWQSSGTAHFTIDSSTVVVDSLQLENEGQRVLLDGVISRDPAQALDFAVSDVLLENVMPFYKGPQLHGILNGEGRVFDVYGAPVLLSYLCADSLTIDDERLGDIRVSASWNEKQRFIELAGQLQRDTLKALDFEGTFSPGAEEELDARLLFDRFDLAFIEPYLPEGMSDIQGKVTGDIAITGKLGDPLFNGSTLLENAGLRIDYLNTSYSFTHRVEIRPTMFALDFVKLHDQEGHEATAIGTIVHHAFKDWNFDVTVDMERLLVLNTTVSQNELYYGKAYATGGLQVSGFANNLELTVDARSEPGTYIHFPLGGSMEVGSISFVRFLNGGLAAHQGQDTVDLSGIRLDMDIQVTPDAQFELIFDPTVGDVLSGRGRGNIEMTVTPTGEFSMKGEVEVLAGDYLFTLRNLVNKRFSVDPGGHITWFGDPFDAQLSLNAIYKLRTPLYDIMLEKNEAYKKRVPVEVVMQLKDKLMNPDISYDVRLPSVDEGVRTQVNSVLSDRDERAKQVFSLIVMNKFTAPSTISSPQSGNGNFASTTGSELLSNQVSNWLNRLSKDFDLGVNYRPGNNITTDELEVAVSTQLFNERLQVSTNLGYQTPSSTTNQSALVGDFAADYMLTNDGKLRLKAFSQSNDRNLNQADQAATTQGVGIGYREEFNTMGEFWKKLTAKFRPKAPKEPVSQEAPVTTP
ncbi:MAG: translocation/assembly module TamB [Flavobacteriales bacterium]|nr:translocation/assembly module TamB [Flavobacteriales bacterium]